MAGILVADTIQVDSIKTKAGEAQNASNLGLSGGAGKNLIINGAMAVSQRGTTFADLGHGYYGIDRFIVFHSDDGAVTVSQDTTVPAGQGFKNSMKFDVTTADTSIGAAQYYQFAQKIEGQNIAHLEWGTSNAKSVTLSFWIRSNLTGTYNVYFLNSAANRYHPVNFTIDSANTWEKKVITVAGDTTGTWLTTNGIGMFVLWNLALGSNNLTGTNATWGTAGPGVSGTTQANFLSSTSNELYITGVQLEVGEVASEFDHEKYSDTFKDCLRYFYRLRKTNAWGEFVTLRTYNASNGTGVLNFPEPMRVQPTLSIDKTVNSTNFAYDLNSISIAASDSNVTQCGMAAGSSSGSAFVTGGGATIQSNGASGAIDVSFSFSSEL